MKVDSFINKEFFKKYKLNFLFKNKKNGFTLSELIISGSISISILLSAYYFINIISQLNKNDSSQIKLFSKLDAAIDFILDEINSGKEIIVDKNKIKPSCELPKGEFVFALDFPKQYIREDFNDIENDYLNQTNFSTLDCPIIYSLDLNKKNIYKESYILMRSGPPIDKMGFYTVDKYQNTIVTDKISKKIYDIKLICLPNNWQKIQVKGIELCVDNFKRAAEISITANIDLYNSKEKFITKTSAALNRIDKNILKSSNLDNYGENIQNNGSLCLRRPCNFGPIPLTGGINNKSIAFILDLSGSMSRISRDTKIQGTTRLQKAKIDLINAVFNLKKDIKFQIISFGNRENLMFRNGPRKASFSNKFYAYRWIITRVAYQPETLPSKAIMESMFNNDIGQIIIISDGQISRQESCPFKLSSYALDECASQYNEIVRSNQDMGNSKFLDNRVTIDSVSIGENYCNTFSDSNNWMGKIAKQNGGRCSVLR